MTKIWKAKQLTIIMDYILPNRNCYDKSIFQIFFYGNLPNKKNTS